MIKLGVVGLGKMGLSHFSIANAHPQTAVVACDASGFLLDIVRKYSALPTYKDFDDMLAREPLDAVIIATPSRLHAPMVRKALERGLHVFCEKPFCLDSGAGSYNAGNQENTMQMARCKKVQN